MLAKIKNLIYTREEPKAIRSIKNGWLSGLILVVLCLVVLGIDIQFLSGSPTSITSDLFYCSEQQVEREKDLASINSKISVVDKRIQVFEQAMANPDSRLFLNARDNLAKEKKIKKSLEKKKKGLVISPMGDKYLFLILSLILPFALSIAVANYMLRDFSWLNGGVSSSRAKRVFWIVALLSWLIIVASAIFTSILTVDGKTWYDSSSFCVSVSGFSLLHLALLGSMLSLATPVTVAYLAADTKYKPHIELNSPDGRCAVGRYIDALKKWTFLGGVLMMGIALVWVDFVISQQGGILMAYLVVPFAFTGLLLLIMCRFLWNAYLIRKEYLEERTALGETWQEVVGNEVPPDPTLDYISNEWWRLPTVIYPVLGGILFVVEFLGIGKVLVEVVGK